MPRRWAVSAPDYVSAHQKESLPKTIAIDSFCPGHSFSPLNLASRRVRQAKRPAMRLVNKTAVIYGAGGAIRGAVAGAFAREGETHFLTGRNQAEALAGSLSDSTGPEQSRRKEFQ